MTVSILGLPIVILGLSCFKVTLQDDSTLVYYAVLSVEPSVADHVSDALSSVVLGGTSLSVTVSNIAVTTKCRVSADRQPLLCSCLAGHVWSREICKKEPECCKSNNECHLQKDVNPICHPKTRVSINGSIYLNNEIYYHSMADQTSEKFKTLSAYLMKKIKPVYSTLQAFDGLQITEFRLGVYAFFEMHVNSIISTLELKQKTEAAAQKVNATISVDTEGLVEIHAPPQPVCLNSRVDIVCNASQPEKAVHEWTHATAKQVFQITNGIESQVTSDGAGSTTLTLRNTSGIWTGLITCTIRPVLTGVIAHRARFALDVALLPQINILSEPQFPQCKKGSIKVAVRVDCEIKKSTEFYATEWKASGNKSEMVAGTSFEKDLISYSVNTAVGCLSEDKTKPAIVTCVFKNRKDQCRQASILINVIHTDSVICLAVEDWPDTKANFTAKLRCEGRSGLRLRKCDIDGNWQEEVSQCVNLDLSSIVEDTLLVNKGLGSVSANSEKVFSRLTAATNVTQSINTASNLDTSINILHRMQQLNATFNESTLDDIVKSSSNILNVPLEDVWTTAGHAQGNLSMAVLFLASVEQLIMQTNVSKRLTREAANLQVQTCLGVACESSVFNVSISVGGPGGLVKAAGFKNLVKFLPPIWPNADPNSIVVTAYTDRKLRQGNPEVSIRFQLSNPRPRNHAMMCVAMVDFGDQWSLDRCVWGGPGDEGFCRCQDSSAFATILSRNAISLPGLAEITYVGLGISIASLATFLGIECLVWSAVVKTNSLYLRHVTLVNISLSLLVGDCGLLVASLRGNVSEYWCQACVILQHFFFLAQFCWMFCLSTLLLYQTMFVFADLSKGRYQGVCYLTGYGAPFLIVTTTFLTHDGGAEGSYYDAHSCWLTHRGLLKGSFYSFIIPVGIIVFFNLFSMALVIVKLLKHPKAGGGGAGGGLSGRQTALRILRSIIILTPVFGVTWVFGFATLVLDLAEGTVASSVYYIFSICNSFQGLFILLTACVGEKMVRDALRKRLHPTQAAMSTKETSLTLQSAVDK